MEILTTLGFDPVLTADNAFHHGNKAIVMSFDGVDGAGKTTILKRVYKELASRNSILLPYISSEQNNNYGNMAKFGDKTDQVNPTNTVYLWWLARDIEQKQMMAKAEEAFTNNRVLIALKDRYYDSTYVYQPITPGQKLVNFDARLFYKPEVTFFFDVEPEVSVQRLKKNGLSVDLHETDNIDKVAKRRQAYYDLYEEQKNFRTVYVVNTTHSTIDEVYEAVLTRVMEVANYYAEFSSVYYKA